MSIGTQFATRSEVEALRRKLQQVISGAGVVQHGSDTDMAENFIDLADVPQSYDSAAGCVVAVNTAEDGLHFNPYIKVAEDGSFINLQLGENNFLKLDSGAFQEEISEAGVGRSGILSTLSLVEIYSYSDISSPPTYWSYIDVNDSLIQLQSWDVPGIYLSVLNLDGSNGEVDLHSVCGNVILYTETVDIPPTIKAQLQLNYVGTATLFASASIEIDSPTTTILKGQEFRFQDADQSYSIGFKAPLLVANTTWTLPAADSSGTQALVSDGSGVLSWSSLGLGDLKADGTVPLTADWDAGSYEIRAQTFESDIAMGTAPFVVASTTVVTNLNADLLDGNHASAFALSGHNHDGVYEPLITAIVDARIDDAINSGDATTDGVIDAIRDAMISLGFMAAT